jgi:hypothetical protein
MSLNRKTHKEANPSAPGRTANAQQPFSSVFVLIGGAREKDAWP